MKRLNYHDRIAENPILFQERMIRMDFEMGFNFDEQNNRWDITLSGEIDVFNSPEVKKRLINLLEENCVDLYVQCNNLEYIDSTALGALVGVLKHAKSKGCEIKLISVKPNLLKLFRITNLDGLFSIEGDSHE